MKNNKLKEIRQYAMTDWVPILKEDTQFFLEDLIKRIGPKTILEVGTAIGFSALVFSETLSDNVIIDTIEIDEDRIKKAEENIKTFGKSNINIIKGNAIKILPLFDRKYDFIFIDANKSKTYDYFIQALRLSHKGSYIVCDNIGLDGETFNDNYPARKHRTSIFRLREFVDIIKIAQNMTEHSIAELNGIKIKSFYYNIGDGINVSEVL